MQLLGIPIKDWATIVIGTAALITSVSVARFNWNVQRAKKVDDARKAFDDALTGIQTARADIEALRHELGERFATPDSMQRRNLIADRRNFFLAKALVAIRTGGFATSSVDNLLIAAALIESGRTAASIEFYEKSVSLADDSFDRASARRVLGRARILSGSKDEGRVEMLTAVEEFQALAKSPDYDKGRMLRDAAETARRLVAARNDIRWYDSI